MTVDLIHVTTSQSIFEWTVYIQQQSFPFCWLSPPGDSEEAERRKQRTWREIFKWLFINLNSIMALAGMPQLIWCMDITEESKSKLLVWSILQVLQPFFFFGTFLHRDVPVSLLSKVAKVIKELFFFAACYRICNPLGVLLDDLIKVKHWWAYW